MDEVEMTRRRGKGIRTHPGLFLTALVLLLCNTTSLRAEEAEEKHESLQAGVLEVAGSTSFAVNYQKEGGRETTHLRLTPSIGYFILDSLEVQLRASYIFDNVHESSVTDDRSEGFLFTLGPAYNFRSVSNVLIPYLGIDFGTYYQHLSTSVSSRSGVQLALGMGAGCRWMFTDNLGLKLGFQYVHGFGSDDIGDTDFLGLEIGISLFIPTWPTY
jgi:opacity protein-like surface antigen